jgi:hypothetical protein
MKTIMLPNMAALALQAFQTTLFGLLFLPTAIKVVKSGNWKNLKISAY